MQDTGRLIGSLASELACRDQRGVLTVRRALVAAVAIGLALAVTASLVVFADASRLGDASAQRWMCQKIVCMAACASGAWVVLLNVARPERCVAHLEALLPATGLVVLGASFDPSGLSLAGRSASSVYVCMGAIVLLSLPALALILSALRKAAAPTRPTITGAISGLLAGSLGAGAYALACRNDGGLFIMVWYGAALAVVAALGAVAGRRILAW